MKLKYRPEIDGLRAIAVVSVIIYHAQFVFLGAKILPGGFLGVDVFFVISGFLITTILMKSLKKNDSLSIVMFYERRARRILPVLLLVMFASIPFAWNYLYPENLVDFSKSIFSSLFFFSNVYWEFTLQQYGTESSLLKPFLHTWSLAVEEQYYIFLPFLLLFIYRYLKEYIVFLMSSILIISFISAVYFSHYAPSFSFSFYYLPTRLWEFLMGGLISVIDTNRLKMKYDCIMIRCMPFLGLFLVVFSFVFFDLNNNLHPGYITLFPVFGTIS